MNCRTCQYELSQCLDGRLASGRRAVVMDHVAECAECSQFWQELQSAQALVLQLTRPRVSAGFREELFERIETGEGTPPAVFAEPVSIATKVRYTLTGAAAAAAVLMVATLLRREPAGKPDNDNTGHIASVAPGRSDVALAAEDRFEPSPDSHPLQPRMAVASVAEAAPEAEQEQLFQAFKPLTPDLVAVETARQFEQRHRWASYRLTQLDHGQADETMARTLCDDARELGSLGSVLADLRDARWLNFGDQQVDTELRVLLAMLDGKRSLDGDRPMTTVRELVGPALRNTRSLARLTTAITVTPSFDRDSQQQSMARFAPSWSSIIDQIFLVLPSSPGVGDLDPRELSQTFVFHGSCGPVFVAPRSEIRRLSLRFR